MQSYTLREYAILTEYVYGVEQNFEKILKAIGDDPSKQEKAAKVKTLAAEMGEFYSAEYILELENPGKSTWQSDR